MPLELGLVGQDDQGGLVEDLLLTAFPLAHLLTDALDVLGANARLVGHVRSFDVAEDAVHTGSSAG